MNSGIQTLPKEVVNLIAAGEVIDSLAAVVRELAENALDAGATRISVSVWPERWRVRVADNGSGMSLADLQKAASAHSTSKIHSSDDLWKITTLGFRGEALRSLAALAEVEILSRLAGISDGWRVAYDSQGEPVQTEAAAIATGTVVTVANLFGAWPVRRQGLPTTPKQLRAVQTTIQQIALCHPHITWQVQQSGREWFSLCPGKTALPILPQILKQLRQHDLQQLTLVVPTPEPGDRIGGTLLENHLARKQTNSGQNSSSTGIAPSTIQLVLGLPDRCHRRRPDWVKVATNGRLVRSPELEQTILVGMARTLPRDRYPVCFLHLQTCPSQIDWNRHPAKAEIYLHSLPYWQEQVANAIEQALRISPTNHPEAVHSQRIGKLLKVSEEKGTYHVSRSLQAMPSAGENTRKAGEIGLIELRAVAQVHHTYILAEHSTGVWLVEQHIAHERVLYEQLCDRWQLVPLVTPVILNRLTSAQLEQLQYLGVDIEPFGEQMWAARNAPAILADRDDCRDALQELSLGGDLQGAQVATACRSAIRNGTPLNLPEMQTLLDQWKATRNPRTCPHGRPIYLSLEESALARFFRRHWVIGKSHGI
ncbi:DNA mismatch repair endonuclease MutL [Lyngbya aestuarii]|uniref:DNA mismatch repair endonuclease MutL n=1 Tax=Lyngbya aestuarii TaxID=118322 RepID=UPI00403D963E